MIYREDIPFFNDLPVKAEKAAARLWDAVKSPDYNGAQAYNDFVQDCGLQKIDPPPRGVVKRWVAAIQINKVRRPGGPVPEAEKPDTQPYAVPVADTPAAPPVEVAEAVEYSEDDPPALAPSASGAPVAETAVPEVKSSDKAFFELRDRMVDEALQSILLDARAKAVRLVASRLHEMVDSMEAWL